MPQRSNFSTLRTFAHYSDFQHYNTWKFGINGLLLGYICAINQLFWMYSWHGSTHCLKVNKLLVLRNCDELRHVDTIYFTKAILHFTLVQWRAFFSPQ